MTSSEPPPVSGAGAVPRIVRTLVVALYDESGRIRHVHTMHQHEGASDVSERDAIDRARHHATQLGHPVDGLRTAVSSRMEHGSSPHRIDVDTGAFVPLPATRRAT